MRGSDTLVTCDQCGRRVPRTKAVDFQKRFSYGTELHNENDVRSMLFSRKVYYCISCAKHRGIFEKKKEQAARSAGRFH
ncbi:MAG: hypothetical protein KGH59_03145 [Candidatus Micrarchaeota archaeon]|nr:hypothetical protein [Candidatus Micrarchaeota archaeon]